MSIRNKRPKHIQYYISKSVLFPIFSNQGNYAPYMTIPIILSKKEIHARIKELEGWTVDKNKLRKEFSFNDFMDGLNFIVKLAPFFEENDHHPDIHILYNKIIFELQRFDIGGKITDKDFITAKEIQTEYNKRNSF